MSKGIFITATGTDIGKTYVTALIAKKMREIGLNVGYYKAVLSGANCVDESDAGYVKKIAGLNQKDDTLISYLFDNPVSPHLASKLAGDCVNMSKIIKDYEYVAKDFDYICIEGSGGVVCPLRWDTTHILLEDVIKTLKLNTLIVADAGLGTINSTVLTVEYLNNRNIGIKGIIVNNYKEEIMQADNLKMIEEITKIKILAVVKPNDTNIAIDDDLLVSIFE